MVATAPGEDPELHWYAQEHGGVMVLEPKVFRRAFLTETNDAEDLLFVAVTNPQLDEQSPLHSHANSKPEYLIRAIPIPQSFLADPSGVRDSAHCVPVCRE